MTVPPRGVERAAELTPSSSGQPEPSTPPSSSFGITVVIPVYNAESTLGSCLDALEAQSLPRDDYRVVVIDNNSTDDSMAVLQRFPDVEMLEETRQGSYAARNRGLREVTGPIVAFIDPDCVPEPTWLEEGQRALRDPATMIVMGPADAAGADDETSLALLARYERHKDAYILSSSRGEAYYGHTNNMMVRAALFDEMGPFLERRRGSDTILVRQTVDRFGVASVQYAPNMVVRHLEIRSTRDYLRKMRIYGKSRRRYDHVVTARPLSMPERFRTFGGVVRSAGLSPLRALHLLALLAIGVCYWYAGSLSALGDGASEDAD